MNVFAKFDGILSMSFQDIKERKSNGHTDGRKDKHNLYSIQPGKFVLVKNYKGK